ncbi:MAG TPA: glycosyltransferase family 2 protein [Actinoplanes sp.]
MSPSPPPPATTRDPRLSPTVSVIIPALNEEDNLPLVLEGLPRVDEVVIVDGGSADDTVAIAREIRPDAVVVRQSRSGKGNALACGFAACHGDVVVTLNADGSTDPGEIPRFVDALLSGAEVAHGSRFRDGGGDLGGRRLDRFGNAVLSRLVNLLFGTSFTDIGYGYNAYWRALLPALDLPPVEPARSRRGLRHWGDGAEIEPMLNLRTAAQGLRVVEVASIGYPPINGAREGRRLHRAVRALRTAFSEYVRRRRFGPRPDPAGGALPATAARMGEDTAARMRRSQIGATRTRIGRRSDGTAYDTGTQLRWRDLTRAPEPEPPPTTDDLGPEARHSLPLYPPPDPAWTAAQGRHAAPELPREVGGRRRRLDAGGRY